MHENKVKEIIFTYPNIGIFHTSENRDSLKTRLMSLEDINSKYKTRDFNLIEMPANFLKNDSMVNPKTVSDYYSIEQLDDNELKYMLHTEPVENNKKQLKWYDPRWMNQFLKHIFSIIDFLGIEPYAIELHPGTFLEGQNNIKVFSEGINTLYTTFFEKYHKKVIIFVENRIRQFIASGEDLNEFWEFFSTKYPQLADKVGIVLDIQQLYTNSKFFGESFTDEFDKIPNNSLYGVHIHHNHGTPSIEDDIPWKYVADNLDSKIKSDRPFHVLPEVHNPTQVEETYNFCKNILNL
ncbi:hypothetical protein [Methanobacterium sp. SMA-27]|uniref:hypothetical protein n=1 Tax=Methanobacterium sp. SMA-27 TaxID=1495336 RepID=UPI00064F12DF|nr:hypothetical protein [Methanobacterium sp. SMA-27]